MFTRKYGLFTELKTHFYLYQRGTNATLINKV